ncbi:MAG: coenzyme F420-0:L-glutamate ligase [Methanobrevibacter sp.]|nr:coenzyme F420-0:L-glutamate ligase [Methanobrevibacter sp.]
MSDMKLEIIGLETIPLVNEKEDISKLILKSSKNENISLENGDIVLIAETLIAKSEGNVILLEDIEASNEAIQIAKKTKKDPKIIQAILNESKEIVALGSDFIITETKHGFVCANAGIDESNIDNGLAKPIPPNPDKSADKICKKLENILEIEIAVIITDTQGRAFRNGAIGTAIGSSGINPLWVRKGEKDLYGRELQTTEIAVADELASAASLLMGQADEGIPIVIIKGFTPFDALRNEVCGIQDLIRDKKFDVFRK